MDAVSAGVRSAVQQWLISGSEKWQPVAWNDIDNIRSTALQMLVESGLAERQDTIDAWWDAIPDPPRAVVNVIVAGEVAPARIAQEIAQSIPGWAGRVIAAQRRPECDWRLTLRGQYHRQAAVDFLTSERLTESQRAALESEVLASQAGRVSVRLQPADDGKSAVHGTTTSTNEARDCWMYEQKQSGMTHGQIRADLKREHSAWDAIDSDQGVGLAISRYCQRNSLPAIRRKK